MTARLFRAPASPPPLFANDPSLEKPRALAPVTPLSRSLHSSRAAAGGHATSQHQHTDENNSQTFFDFTEENYKLVENVLGKYPGNYKQVRL